MSDFLALAGLALVDSLSVGTLVIPIALIIMWRRVRIGLMGCLPCDDRWGLLWRGFA